MMVKLKGPGRIKRLISWIWTILIVAGVFLALSPSVKDMCYNYYNTFLAQKTIEQIRNNPGGQSGGNERDASLDPSEEEFPTQLEPMEAVLEIPVLDILVNINYGIEKEDFKEIPSFYPQSGYPDTGNVSIAGHRNASNFLNLHKLEYGDRIRLYYDGRMYIYVVDKTFITNDRDWSIIEPTSTPAITLTTCDPPGPNPTDKRLIVRAYLSDVIVLQ